MIAALCACCAARTGKFNALQASGAGSVAGAIEVVKEYILEGVYPPRREHALTLISGFLNESLT